MKFNILKLISFVCSIIIIAMSFSACGGGTLKKPIPEPEYTSFGYSINPKVTDGRLTVTYALVGFKGDKITNVYFDKIEKKFEDEKSTSTNKEMGDAYGLGYISDRGEFNVQLSALENYIMGNKMTLEEVNKIETYEKDAENTSVPKPNTDLAVACELNIAEYIDLVNEAAENRIEKECMKIGIGEKILVYNTNGEIKISFAVISTDYMKKINYSFLDFYSIKKDSIDVRSEKQKATESSEIADWVRNINGYEAYMLGRTVGDSAGVETYNTGDGITMNIPRPNTDLAKVCSVDIGYFIDVIYEASNRSK